MPELPEIDPGTIPIAFENASRMPIYFIIVHPRHVGIYSIVLLEQYFFKRNITNPGTIGIHLPRVGSLQLRRVPDGTGLRAHEEREYGAGTIKPQLQKVLVG